MSESDRPADCAGEDKDVDGVSKTAVCESDDDDDDDDNDDDDAIFDVIVDSSGRQADCENVGGIFMIRLDSSTMSLDDNDCLSADHGRAKTVNRTTTTLNKRIAMLRLSVAKTRA